MIITFILGMFAVNQLTEKNSVNRFSINRTETDKMAVRFAIQQIAVHLFRWWHWFDFKRRRCQFQQHVLIEWHRKWAHHHLLVYYLQQPGCIFFAVKKWKRIRDALIG